MSIVRFDEFIITRESICGNFRPCGLGWGAIRGRLFEKHVGFWFGLFSKNVVFANGVAVGDLGAKIATKLPQQRFLDVIF